MSTLVKSPVAPLELVVSPAKSSDFGQARAYLHAAKMSMVQSAALMILTGAELERLYAAHAVQRGGDRRSEDQTRNAAGLKWGDLVKAELGISEDTALRYRKMFEAARARVPLLNGPELMKTPLGELPKLRQIQIQEAVQATTNGETAQQLMLDWGIARRPANEAEDGKRLHYPVKEKKQSAAEIAAANRAAAKARLVGALSALKAALDDKQVRRWLEPQDWVGLSKLAQDRLKIIATLAGKAEAAAAKKGKS